MQNYENVRKKRLFVGLIISFSDKVRYISYIYSYTSSDSETDSVTTVTTRGFV